MRFLKYAAEFVFMTADVRSYYHWYSIICIKTSLINKIHIMHINVNTHTCMSFCLSVCMYVRVCVYVCMYGRKEERKCFI